MGSKPPARWEALARPSPYPRNCERFSRFWLSFTIEVFEQLIVARWFLLGIGFVKWDFSFLGLATNIFGVIDGVRIFFLLFTEAAFVLAESALATFFMFAFLNGLAVRTPHRSRDLPAYIAPVARVHGVRHLGRAFAVGTNRLAQVAFA